MFDSKHTDVKMPFTRLSGFRSARTVTRTSAPDDDADGAMSNTIGPDETLLEGMAEQLAALSAPTRSGIRRGERIRLGLVGAAGILFGSIIGSVFVLPGLVAFTVLGLGLGYAWHAYVVHRREQRLRRSADRWLGRQD